MKKIIFLFILFSMLLIACGNEAPVLSSINHKVLIYENGGLNMNSNAVFLSVYFILDDPNGLEDIVEVKITNTETDYSWRIPKDILLKSIVTWEDRKFVGYSFLEYENASAILTGEYLVEAIDSVGNIAEGTFFVEMEGTPSNSVYKLSGVNYKVSRIKTNELKISGDRFESTEIKILTDTKAFGGGRKIFKNGKNILIDDDFVRPQQLVSVKVNKDENTIYFLKNFTLN
jgi:hypothetical protein